MNTTEAAFVFEKYKISRFAYIDPIEDQINIFINFTPTGVYSKTEGLFILTNEITVTYGEKNDISLLSLLVISDFRFKDTPDLSNIPEYFYSNSIAIVYPYVRAFVNTLTSLASVKPLMLGLLNLTSLGNILKENTSAV